MTVLLRLCFIWLMCGLLPCAAHGALTNLGRLGPVVSQISEASGQPLSGLKGIIQDRAGFMWLASNQGLLRYDGQAFRRFVHQPDNPNSLPHNDVRDLVEDENGFIWLATRGGGLSRFNPKTERFDNFIKGSDTNSLDSNQLNSLSLGNNHVLWVASNQGINRFDRMTLRNIRLDVALKPNQSDTGENIQRIVEDSQGRLWFSVHRKGLYLYTSKEGGLTHFAHQPGVAGSIDDNTVSEIFESPNGDIWVGTALGINRYNAATGQFTTLSIPLNHSNKVAHASVTRIYQDSQGSLWVGTFYNGVSRLKPGAAGLTALNDVVTAPESLNALHINDIYQDSSGTLWFVTPRSGLFKLRPEHLAFEHFQLRNKAQSQLQSMAYDDNGELWLGTAQGLLLPQGLQPQVTVTGSISALLWWPQKGMVVASQNEGVQLIDHSGQIQSLAAADVAWQSLALDNQGQLILGSDSHIYRLATPSAHLQLLSDTSGAQRMIAIEQNLVTIDNNKRVWRFALDTASWQPIDGLTEINALYAAAGQSEVWLGGSAGLYKLDTRSWQWQPVAELANVEINSIVGQSKPVLWLGSDQGLLRFDLAASSFRRFGRGDGLRLSHFSNGLGLVREDGRIVMADAQQIVRFLPQGLFYASPIEQPSSILLSDFKLFNQAVLPKAQDPDSPLSATIDKLTSLELSYRQNWFSIAFASSDYRQPEKLQYSYRLKGLSDKWIAADANARVASFTSIAPGEYTLQLRVIDPSNNKENIRSLKLVVTPPWWASKLAYAVYVLLAVGVVYLFNFVRTRQLRIRAHKLEQAVNERTLELKQRADTIAQLLADKEALIANISHEFRTPLTLILGPLEAQLDGTADPQARSLLSLAQSNGKRLLNMVDQLLDLARSKDQTQATLVQIAVLQTCRVLLAQFKPLAARHGIELSLQISMPDKHSDLFIEMQPDAFEKILSNLLSNAIKYGGDNKTITLVVELIQPRVRIKVIDQGPGISPQDQTLIFERFARLKNHSGYVSGAGIGLALVKQLCELHGGNIKLHSELGSGSTFFIELPLATNTDGQIAGVNEALLQAAAEQVKRSEQVLLPAQSGPSGDKPTVLVVEDNRDMRRYILSCLVADYDCFEAEDGEQGIAVAQDKLPDLVLSDVMMPNIDGFELTRLLKSNHITSHIPVILLTARGDSKSRLEGWAQRADEYLEKPFNAKELLARIDNLMAQRAILRAQFAAQFAEPESQPVQHKAAAQTTPENPVHRAFLQQVNEVLEANYRDCDFDVASFADKLALSHRQFGRKMKALLNMTPAEALRNFRLQQSCLLLEEGVTPSVASHKCGFATHSYYSQCFKSKYKCSPSEYHKQSA